MVHFNQASFFKSASKLSDLPPDRGIEVAFVGRSNAGKSSALNCLTRQKQLARTSKTPGRTQLINIFRLSEDKALIDLPGYGYAKVSEAIKKQWQQSLSDYLQERDALKGLVVLMDIRHPLKQTDEMIIQWASQARLSVHCLLTKADKLSHSQANQQMFQVKKALEKIDAEITVQTFSSTKQQGRDELVSVLSTWFESE